jgi:(E)-4-hydroxy-3-methylbut-2-enyl-diphosphate synthase
MVVIFPMTYCKNPYEQERLNTEQVRVGSLHIGSNFPIRVQSMTTADTMDTHASVEESVRMLDAGCEIVRLTAPSKKEAENLQHIKQALSERGYQQPLVADIHFTPNAAEIAALHVEKVRVNPGNYADKKKFEEITYTDESYQSELLRIEEKFTPLVKLCKSLGRAMRIGTNHGSLSDRILSRYGDTPEGMVASAYEFIEVCEKNDYFNLVISMKASNTLVMVQAYRLLVSEMMKRGRHYPLHLGVTEAGDGEDGRIKSAVGIGSLLVDGLGDTVRVSLTEAPEFEVPVAQKLIEIAQQKNIVPLPYYPKGLPFNPFHFERRTSSALGNIGGGNAPVVVADFSQLETITPANLFACGYTYSIALDKWTVHDAAADYLYLGKNTLNFELPGTLRVIVDETAWTTQSHSSAGTIPMVSLKNRHKISHNQPCFCSTRAEDLAVDLHLLQPQDVLVLQSSCDNKVQWFRWAFMVLKDHQKSNPVVFNLLSESSDLEQFQLEMGVFAGSLFVDGLGDGLWIQAPHQPKIEINKVSFGVLQATRLRISKTEYISCPSCGRTLFDLQETTAKIRDRTSHLKGLKIGIMGCIVNGPGEMADADYGYVGSGPGKITLYKEKEVVRKNVNTEDAVDSLIDLIKSHGDWIDPPAH